MWFMIVVYTVYTSATVKSLDYVSFSCNSSKVKMHSLKSTLYLHLMMTLIGAVCVELNFRVDSVSSYTQL